VWDEPDVWQAIGQVGSFVVAIGALIVALVSRKDSNAARVEASRSATAAEASAQEAKRANELTESERHERAGAERARAQHEADLVRGAIEIHSGTEVGNNRILVSDLRVTVVNHGTQPAIDVRYRHMEYRPEFTLLTSAIPPDRRAVQSAFTVEPRVEIANDNTELIPGTEIKYQLGGVVWIRRGDASPVRA
jgi:formylmethanofuran dehydrogenase subunit E